MINKRNILFIFDWDDTLFPTSWTIDNNINIDSLFRKNQNSSEENTYDKYFNYLDKIIFSLFIKIKKYGEIIIITNATLSWINKSSSILPNTRKLLKYIKIISAREDNKQYSNNPTHWKIISFKNEVFKREINEIYSIGDASYEYIALMHLKKITKNKFLKSIKLLENPDFKILIDELSVIYNAIPEIIKEEKDIDMKFFLNIK